MRIGDGTAHAIRDSQWMVSRNQQGHQRRATFRDRRCYEDLGERLGQFAERFGVEIHSYVLVPNRYHLQLELGPGAGHDA
jgi:hypothetical protein